MSYMTRNLDGKVRGPYPNEAGEFCGNHLPGSSAPRFRYQSQEDAEQSQRKYLDRMRFGKPSNCQAGTSEEMAAQGWVGLYLKESRPLLSWETAIETDELTEEFVSRKAT